MIQRRDAHATTSRQRQRQRLHNRGPTAPAGASDKENEAIVEPASSPPMKSALVPLEGMSRKRKRGQESVVTAAAGRGDGGGVSVVDIVTSTSSAGSTMTTTTTTTVSRGVQRDMEDVFEGEAIESGNLDSESPSRNDWLQEIPASDDDDDVSDSDDDGGGEKVGEDEEYIAPFEEHQAPEPLLAENTFLTPEYRVLRALGHGNFSTTYLAEQIPPDPEPPDSDSDLSSSAPRLVAIKRLKQPFAAIGENEYSLLEFLHSGRMSTPRHIISPITSFHTPSEHFHLVLEPLDSGRPVSLPPCQCPHHGSHHVSACPERHYALAKILLQLLSGLQSLHNLNLIHADLTPGNILFLPESNRIKIIDLGNAIRVEDRAAYLDDFEVQSAAYRAPEILLGYGPIGRRMDIWSAGVIAVELLLGGEIVGNGVVRGELMRSDTEGREAMVRRVVELMGGLGCYKDGLWWKEEYEEFVAADGILTRWLLENTRDEGLVGFLGGFLETRVERRKTAVQLLKHEWLLQGLLGEWGVVLANAKDYDDDGGSVTTPENEGEFAEQEVVERASLDDSIDGGVALLEEKDQVQLELDLDIEDAFAREKNPESLQQRQTILRSSPLGAERPGTRFDRQTSPLLPSSPPTEIRVKSEPPLSISSSPPALEAQRFQFKPAQFEIPEETPQRPSTPTVAEASSTNVKEPEEEDEQQSPFQQQPSPPPPPPPPSSSSLSPLLPPPESHYPSAISPTPQAPSSTPPPSLPEQTRQNKACEACSQVKDNDGQDNGDDEQEQEQEQDDEETDFSSPSSSSPPHHSSSSSSVVVVPPRSDVWTRDLAKEGAGDPDEYNEDDDVMLL